jgi:hypothetical protein
MLISEHVLSIFILEDQSQLVESIEHHLYWILVSHVLAFIVPARVQSVRVEVRLGPALALDSRVPPEFRWPVPDSRVRFVLR